MVFRGYQSFLLLKVRGRSAPTSIPIAGQLMSALRCNPIFICQTTPKLSYPSLGPSELTSTPNSKAAVPGKVLCSNDLASNSCRMKRPIYRVDRNLESQISKSLL